MKDIIAYFRTVTALCLFVILAAVAAGFQWRRCSVGSVFNDDSTPKASTDSAAWSIGFADGTDNVSDKSGTLPIRLVHDIINV